MLGPLCCHAQFRDVDRHTGGNLHYHSLRSAAQEGLERGETGDLSLKMLLFLGAGLALWTVYGVLRADVVIMAANGVSLTLLGVIVYLKLRNEHP